MKIDEVKLRQVVLPTPRGAVLRLHDTHRRRVDVKVRNLTSQQREKLMETLVWIRDHLRQPNEIGLTEEILALGASYAAFVVTRDKAIVAVTHTTDVLNYPFVIFNERAFSKPASFFTHQHEFAITLLHELYHLLIAMGIWENSGPPSEADRYAHSKYEARHDLLCYYFLAVDIPGDHWALTEYPELLSELFEKKQSNIIVSTTRCAEN